MLMECNIMSASEGLTNPNITSFTIEGYGDSNGPEFSQSYQAERGMTWEDWINSEYNTNGFYIDTINSTSYSVFINLLDNQNARAGLMSDTAIVAYDGGNPVSISDEIITDTIYPLFYY